QLATKVTSKTTANGPTGGVDTFIIDRICSTQRSNAAADKLGVFCSRGFSVSSRCPRSVFASWIGHDGMSGIQFCIALHHFSGFFPTMKRQHDWPLLARMIGARHMQDKF